MESINRVRLTCGYKVGQRIQISLLRLTLHQLALLKRITLVTTTQGTIILITWVKTYDSIMHKVFFTPNCLHMSKFR